MNLDAFTDRLLWDLLDEVSFWIKDRDGRFVWVNATLAAQAQTSRELIIGTNDRDWFFSELATVYMRDDIRVMEAQEPILNKPELVMSPDGEVAWYLTSKFPYLDSGGEVLGTYGMSRPMQSVEGLPTEYADLSRIVRFAREQIGQGVTVEQLANVAHISLSTLERTVKKYLNVTPQELLQRIRMHRARQLLINSNLKIGEIGLECGYESFSAFSRAFRKAYGCSPGVMRGRDS